MICQLKDKLLMCYSDCVGAYVKAVESLFRNSTASGAYARLWAYAKQKRLECEQTLRTLNRHTAEHKCTQQSITELQSRLEAFRLTP
jgi:hypothetical protein